ncbi:hypothetical protein HUJ05_000230 [Dendroctonus ponderosae]|nr:hypothetical protein HUJ05_000230 [Dendroctonus ponderosae]
MGRLSSSSNIDAGPKPRKRRRVIQHSASEHSPNDDEFGEKQENEYGTQANQKTTMETQYYKDSPLEHYRCALSETKLRGEGTIKLPKYILIYSGVAKHKRSVAGVGILISEKYEKSMQDIQYINERILIASLETEKGTLHILSVYAPDINKSKEEKGLLYETLEEEVRKISVTEKLLIMGQINA